MSVVQYLKRKYGFSSNATVPSEFIAEELQLELKQVKEIVRRYLHKKTFPGEIQFRDFCSICQQQIESA